MKKRMPISHRGFRKAAGVLAIVLAGALMAGPVVAAKKLRVGIAFNGPINDLGWAQGGYNGAVKLKEDPGLESFIFHEKIQNPDIERTLRRWAVEGYDLVIGHSFEFGVPSVKVAREFPKTVFAIPYFFQTEGLKNVVTYGPQPHEAFYLAGALSALMSKSRKIGSIAGFPIPQQFAEHNSYKLGARAVVPDIQVNTVFISSWSDVSKGKEAAYAMIDQGADVVVGTGSPMLFGAIKAAEERGVYALGDYLDVNKSAPDTVISSIVYGWHAPLKRLVLDIMKGDVKKAYLLGMREGGATLAPFNRKVPSDVAQRIRAMEKELMAGKIKVPYLSEKLID